MSASTDQMDRRILNAGSYRIEAEGPMQWRLRRRGRAVGLYDSLTSAKAAAARIDRVRRRRAALLRWSLLMLAGLTAIALILAVRTTTNPVHAPSAGFVAGMQQAHQSIAEGRTVPGDYSVDENGFTGAVVARPGPETPYDVLMGEYAGRCYVMFWQPGFLPQGGVLDSSLECVPSTAIFGIANSYEAVSPAADRHLPGLVGEDIVWESLLPPERHIRWWVVPAVIAGFFVVIRAGTNLAAVAIRMDGPGPFSRFHTGR